MPDDDSPWSRESFERRQRAEPAATTAAAVHRPQDGTLLREVLDVRQRPEEGFRRYFHGRLCRLWAWYDADRTTLTGFQLLAGPEDAETAITWHADGAFSHRLLSTDGAPGSPKRTQVLEDDAGPVKEETLAAFERYAADIDPVLRGVVLERTREAMRRRGARRGRRPPPSSPAP
jgi:hypothetical protein